MVEVDPLDLVETIREGLLVLGGQLKRERDSRGTTVQPILPSRRLVAAQARDLH
jgi:hypothetical protein